MANQDVTINLRYSGKRVSTPPWEGSNTVTNNAGYFSCRFVRNGVKVPKWRKIIAAGGDASSNMTASRTVYRIQNGEYAVWNKDTSNPLHTRFGGDAYTGFRNDNLWGNYPSVSGASTSIADNQALTYFLRNVRNSRRSVQGGVILGELRETVRMLKRPASALRTGFSDYLSAIRSRSRGVRSDSALRNMISGTWLEFRFGWTPLLNDVEDIAKAAAAIATRHYQTRATGVGTHETFGDVNYRNGTDSVVIRVRHKAEVIYRAGLNETAPGIHSNIETLGLGIRDFLPTVWELIPYSFVIDYFTNIGDIIDAATTSTSGLAWCNKTTRVTSESLQVVCGSQRFAQLTYPKPWDVFVVVGSPETLTGKVVTVTRGKVTNVPVPNFSWSLPSLGQSLNLAALVDQATNTQGSLKRFR